MNDGPTVSGTSDVRPEVRRVPRWLLVWVSVLAGLAVPLVGTGFAVAPLVVFWIVVVGVLAAADRWIDPGITARIWFTVATIAVLLLFAEEGGAFLVPAAVISIVVDLRDRRAATGASEGRGRTGD